MAGRAGDREHRKELRLLMTAAIAREIQRWDINSQDDLQGCALRMADKIARNLQRGFDIRRTPAHARAVAPRLLRKKSPAP